MGDYFRQNNTNSEFSTGDSWIILNTIENDIKSKIEKFGTPLKDWNINIYRGLLTGYNKAFIIDGQVKNKLVSIDPKSAEIIRPILRGRDIKKHSCDFAELYLLNVHNGHKIQHVSPINIEDYPAVKKHLDQFYTELSTRTDKGITPYNLRNCAYLADFEDDKIIYPDIMRMPQSNHLLSSYPYIYFDREKYFVEATNFMITGSNIDILYLFLVSDLGFYIFTRFYSGPQFDSTGFRYKKNYLEEMFVPTLINNSEAINTCKKLISLLKNGVNIDEEINIFWYDILNLENDEIQLIKNYKSNILNTSTKMNDSNLIEKSL